MGLRHRRAAGTFAGVALLATALTVGSTAWSDSAPEQTEPGPVRLLGSTVKPRLAFFDSVRGVRIRFRLDASEAVDATVRIRRAGRELKRFRLREIPPRALRGVVWNGIGNRGRAAPDGRYRVFVRPAGGGPLRAGGFRLRGHVYPVPGRHWFRGAIGEFGAPRSGGRVHEGYDVNAKCGAKLVAVRSGRVVGRGYDPVLYGHFLKLKGRKQRRVYFYSHLAKPPVPKRGALVKTGQRVGSVGRTGNARYVPGCHLHFEIHKRGRPIDPAPHLRRWDRYS